MSNDTRQAGVTILGATPEQTVMVSDAIAFIARDAHPEFGELKKLFTTGPITVRFSTTAGQDPRMTAYFDERDGIIEITTSSLDSDTLAALLIHEGSHVLDYRNQISHATGDPFLDHLLGECAAYCAQRDFWKDAYPDGRHRTLTAPEADNDKTVSVNDDELVGRVAKVTMGEFYEAVRHGYDPRDSLG